MASDTPLSSSPLSGMTSPQTVSADITWSLQSTSPSPARSLKVALILFNPYSFVPLLWPLLLMCITCSLVLTATSFFVSPECFATWWIFVSSCSGVSRMIIVSTQNLQVPLGFWLCSNLGPSSICLLSLNILCLCDVTAIFNASGAPMVLRAVYLVRILKCSFKFTFYLLVSFGPGRLYWCYWAHGGLIVGNF